MTGRVQSLRSSVAGNRPTGRQPGELYTNWADAQFGVINASNAAQDLIAVRFFSAAANYNKGDYVVQGGFLYTANAAITAGAFNSGQWSLVGGSVAIGDTPPATPNVGALWWDSAGGQLYVYFNDGTSTQWVVTNNTGEAMSAYLPLSGGTMTGVLNAPQGISAPQAIGDNRIINGDMRIDQRNNGTAGTANAIGTYTVDRWSYYGSQASKGTWGRNLNIGGPIVAAGFPYQLGFQSSSAYASVAADQFIFFQDLEADVISDFAWGTASAQPVTLSFWVLSGTSGTFSGAIQNYASTRAYPFSFSVSSAGWTKSIVTIPGDTAGTWVASGNAGAMIVVFDLGSGATHRGPANAWSSNNYNGVTGAVSVVATNGATFYVTGVKLEVGSVATPFNRQSLAKSMADCQRYYQTLTIVARANSPVAGGAFDFPITFPIMRATPAYAGLSGGTSSNVTSPGIGVGTNNGTYYTFTATAAGDAYVSNVVYSLSAEL